MKVVYTGSRNLYPYMKSTIQSLLDHNKVDWIYLLTEDDEFPYELPKNSTVINVSNQTYFPSSGINFTSPFTYFCLLRVCLAELLPKEDKVISLDIDTIVNDSLEEMWDIDLTGKWFAMCPEYIGGYRPFGKDKPYYNAGVAVYNLKQIRKDKIIPTLVEYLNTTYSRCMDQEAWNYYGQDKAVALPVRFNENPYTGYTDDPAIIHYCGNMNWQTDRKMYRHEYLDKYMDRCAHYMIHVCNDREWYVNDYLLPSMLAQGIDEKNIHVWHDKKCVGNLESFVASCEWIAKNADPSKSTWHIQDDVVISGRFREVTDDYELDGIANGFCNNIFDGYRTNYISKNVSASQMWFSFQCVLIPNDTAARFAYWFRNVCQKYWIYPELLDTGKCDDQMFRAYILEFEPDIPAHNIYPNIVDHVDYLIGGTIINAQRERDKYTAYWRDDALDESVKELEKALGGDMA